MPTALLDDLAHWPRLPHAAAAAMLVLLASARWFGLSLTLPLVAQLLTIRVRLALALVLGVATLPLLEASPSAAAALFVPFDSAAHGHGWLAATGVRLLAAGLIELGIGAALGIGARVVLCGVQAAGELIDQQAGLAFSHVFHPGTEDDGSPLGALIGLTALAVFLLLAPCGGDLALAAAAFDLFEALPVGEAITPRPASDLIVVLVQQSLVLALHVAAPVLAVMSLVTVAVSWLGRTAPALAAGPVHVPVRIVTCLLILAVSLSGAADVLAERFELLLERAPELITVTNSH
jgi:flagellar biosynthesis protein FliR